MHELERLPLLPGVTDVHNSAIQAPFGAPTMHAVLSIRRLSMLLDPPGSAPFQVAADRVTQIERPYGRDPVPAVRELMGAAGHAPLEADLATVG